MPPTTAGVTPLEPLVTVAVTVNEQAETEALRSAFSNNETYGWYGKDLWRNGYSVHHHYSGNSELYFLVTNPLTAVSVPVTVSL
jgi:hypothetical protein